LSLLDSSILIVFLVATTALGAWLGRGDKNLGDFLLASRQMPWWLILGSIVATETSTATFLSVPGIAYDPKEGDFRFLQVVFGFALGRILVTILLLPRYFEGSLYSAYEVLHKRFGVKTRRIASGIFLVARNLGDGLRLYLTALALQQLVSIWPDYKAWVFPFCVLAIGVSTMIYTSVGGMRSVVWNDCIQLVIYLLGALLAAVIILQRLPNGLETVLETARAEDKFRIFDLHFENSAEFAKTGGYTLFAGLLGGAFLSFGTHGVDQMMVQRYLTARSRRDAAIALVGSGLFVIAQFALFLMIGILLRAFYLHVAPQVEFVRNDQVFATFIAHELPSGAKGLILAAILAAAMSTLSSSFSSSASALMSDFVGANAAETAQRSELFWGRVATYAFGVIQMLVALAVYYRGADQSVIDQVLLLAGITTGLTLGIFLLGQFVRQATERDALVGIFVGAGAVVFVLYGFQSLQVHWMGVHDRIWRIPSFLNPVIFSLTVVAAGWLSSFLSKNEGVGAKPK
jgi:solute:Na+ symporter, SSS family